jgi:hypothetical protein
MSTSPNEPADDRILAAADTDRAADQAWRGFLALLDELQQRGVEDLGQLPVDEQDTVRAAVRRRRATLTG